MSTDIFRAMERVEAARLELAAAEEEVRELGGEPNNPDDVRSVIAWVETQDFIIVTDETHAEVRIPKRRFIRMLEDELRIAEETAQSQEKGCG